MRSTVAVALLVVAACATEPTSPPLVRQPEAPDAVLLPAWAYRKVWVPFPGQRSELLDVNDRNQMVGFADDDAVMLDLHGGTTLLGRAGGGRAAARAVNSSGAAAGWVETNWQHPAIWASRTASPLLRPELGWVWDMNDRAEAVGAINTNGTYQAFFWENKASFTTLPFPRGATWTQATGINNDRVIVGLSSVGGVMWRLKSTGWAAMVLKDITPWAVDAANGTVGADVGSRPAWGDPHLAGLLGGGGIANGINPDGTISGGVSNAVFGPMTAFVANRSGGMTLLPSPAGSTYAQAYNSNRCGLVVGSRYLAWTSVLEATYWDPGC